MFDPNTQHRPSRTFGKLHASPDTSGLHEQLTATQAAASRARRGWTLRVALGFAAFALVAALSTGPHLDEALYRVALAWQDAPADDFTTASIAPTSERSRARAPEAPSQAGSYIVRRSVLNAPGIVCVVTDTTSNCN